VEYDYNEILLGERSTKRASHSHLYRSLFLFFQCRFNTINLVLLANKTLHTKMEVTWIFKKFISLNHQFPLTKVLLLVIVFDHLATAQVEPSQGQVVVGSNAFIAVCSESVLQKIQSWEINWHQRSTNGVFKKLEENSWNVPHYWVSTNETQNFL